MTALVEMLRPAAELAVARAIHAERRDEFHERYPPGQCPMCSVTQNALATAAPKFKQRIAEILEQMETPDGR